MIFSQEKIFRYSRSRTDQPDLSQRDILSSNPRSRNTRNYSFRDQLATDVPAERGSFRICVHYRDTDMGSS